MPFGSADSTAYWGTGCCRGASVLRLRWGSPAASGFRGHALRQRTQHIQPLNRIAELQAELFFRSLDRQNLRESMTDPNRIVQVHFDAGVDFTQLRQNGSQQF